MEWIKQGNFSQGFGSFFTGTYQIDNKNGTITDLYEVLIGADPVSNVSSILLDVRFYCKEQGFSGISIRNGRVCNATAYVPSTIRYDAFVSVGPAPTFTNLTEAIQGLWYPPPEEANNAPQ